MEVKCTCSSCAIHGTVETSEALAADLLACQQAVDVAWGRRDKAISELLAATGDLSRAHYEVDKTLRKIERARERARVEASRKP